MEVRFANEQDIFRGIYHAIQSKLEKTTLINPPVEASIYGVSDNGVSDNNVSYNGSSNQLNENNSSNNYVTNQVFTETPKNYYV
jgi:DNA mismatch repair ATPase MutL